jgi:3D (Asp-Asp-Asp) domain-containing protein
MNKIVATLLAVCGAAVVIIGFVGPAYAQQRIRDVRVVENGVPKLYQSRSNNVQDFLEEYNIALFPQDQINMDPDARFIDHRVPVIEITRGIEIVVVVEGEEYVWPMKADVRAGYVVDLVEEQFGEGYFYNVRRSHPIYDGQVIEFNKPISHTFTSNIPIPYDTTHNYDPTIKAGEEVVVQEGSYGEAELVAEIIMLAGLRIDSRLLSEIVVSEPVEQIVSIGTRPRSFARYEIPTADGEFTFAKSLTMMATAYTAEYECTGKRPTDPGYGITASGMAVQHGVVAVDPRVIPLGTPLFVEGYGYAVAADTGAAIRGNSIDLFMHSVSDARNFGRRTVTVYILESN